MLIKTMGKGKAEDWESQMIDGRWWEREWERASGIFFVFLLVSLG